MVNSPSFHRLLFDIDQEIADKTQVTGCPFCKGRFDAANYQRKPRGLPEGAGYDLTMRLSFCCRLEGCRKRSTPKSLRFAGRRVWLASIVLLLSGHASRESQFFIGILAMATNILKRYLPPSITLIRAFSNN